MDRHTAIWNSLHDITVGCTTTVFNVVVTRNNPHTWTIGSLFGDQRGGAATTTIRIREANGETVISEPVA